MAVQSTVDAVQVTLTSVTATISCPLYILNKSHVQVVRTRDDTDTALVLDSDYTVTGAGSEAGFSVVLQGTNVQVGDKITVLRNMPFTQLQDIKDGGERSGPLAEKGLDELTMMCQELLQRLSKTIRVPRTAVDVGELPLGSTNVVIALDTNGNLTTLPDGQYGGIIVVNHGVVAGTARPTNAEVVYWVGAVEPTNANNGDLWYDNS